MYRWSVCVFLFVLLRLQSMITNLTAGIFRDHDCFRANYKKMLKSSTIQLTNMYLQSKMDCDPDVTSTVKMNVGSFFDCRLPTIRSIDHPSRLQTDHLYVPSWGPPGGQVCSPGQHWVGLTRQPEQTNTAGAMHDGNAPQKILCGCRLDPWALSRGQKKVCKVQSCWTADLT